VITPNYLGHSILDIINVVFY